MLPPVIRIRGLHHRHADGTVGLSGIDLDIGQGELLLVCGANGSGKTTLLRHLNGLLLPTSGTVTVDGLDTREAGDRVRRLVGLCFQDADAQLVGETVGEDAAFGPENLGLARDEVRRRVDAALRRFGLLWLADRPCHVLSGGEKRRLALAGVLAMEPRVVLLDEPLASLDHPGACDLLAHLARLKEDGIAVVVASHDDERFWGLADRVAVASGGRLVATGRPADVEEALEGAGVRRPGIPWTGLEAPAWPR